MDIYILDDQYRRIDIIDSHESFIWTERYNPDGEFEMVIESTNENRNRLKEDVVLMIPDSFQMMKIETITDTEDDEGRSMLNVTGPSWEAIFKGRVARQDLVTLNTAEVWTLTGTPMEIAKKILRDVTIVGVLSTRDIIAQLGTVGPKLYPLDSNPLPTDEITIKLDPTDVFTAVSDLLGAYGLGWRVTRDESVSPVYLNYEYFVGSDRTTGQATYPATVFSPEFGNIKNTTQLKSVANWKNVAYVFAENGYRLVRDATTDPILTGVERRVMFVKSDSELFAGVALQNVLEKEGQDALTAQKRTRLLDGEVPFSAEEQWFIGDYVEVRDRDGSVGRVRVVERIFVSDVEGDRRYPTFEADTLIESGDWVSWQYNIDWSEIDPDLDWADF